MSLLKRRSIREGIPRLVRLPSKSSAVVASFYDAHTMRNGSFGDGNSLPSSPAIKKAYRLVVVGSAGTGKTALVQRFLDLGYDDRYLPTIENFHRKLYKVKGELIQLDIMDRSGLDPFPASRKLAYGSGDLFLIVSSVDNAQSVEQMADIYEQIVECKQARYSFSATTGSHASPYNSSPASCSSANSTSNFTFTSSSSNHSHQKPPVLFVLNKTDLPQHRWQATVEEVMEVVRETLPRPSGKSQPPLPLETCSAALDENVAKAFGRLFALAKLPKLMRPELHKQLRTELSADGLLEGSGGGEGANQGAVNRSVSQPARKRILKKMRTRFSRDNTLAAGEEEVSAAAVRRSSLRTDLLLNRAKSSLSNAIHFTSMDRGRGDPIRKSAGELTSHRTVDDASLPIPKLSNGVEKTPPAPIPSLPTSPHTKSASTISDKAKDCKIS